MVIDFLNHQYPWPETMDECRIMFRRSHGPVEVHVNTNVTPERASIIAAAIATYKHGGSIIAVSRATGQQLRVIFSIKK